MRWRDIGHVSLSRDLWHLLAARLGVDSVLPGAVHDELGMYSAKTLLVGIKGRREPSTYNHPASGDYTYGHIRLFPCPRCQSAFLTHVYLDELYHARLHQYFPRLYDTVDHWRQADLFATDRSSTSVGP